MSEAPDKGSQGVPRPAASPLRLSDRIALKPAEVAAALGVGERTLRKWMREEDLPYFRVDGAVRVPTAALEEWIKARVVSERRSEAIAEEIFRDLGK